MKKLFASVFALIAIVHNCYSQKYFEVEPTFNCKCGDFTTKLSLLPKYSEADVKKAFDFISYKSGLEFRYPQGGCQQRAQMMHKLLDDLRIEHARVWLFAPIDLDPNDNTQLEINDKNNLAKDNIIKWGYHVAPCVIMSKSGQPIDTMIIDPSLRKDKPMKIREWFSAMKNSSQAKYTFIKPQYYFFNTQNNGASSVLNGFFYTYTPLQNQVTMYDNAVVERELAVNDVALFLKQKIDGGYPDSKGEIKALLGYVPNMVSFFASQQRMNSIVGVTLRDMLNDNGPLLNAAQSYYNERVLFWLKTSLVPSAGVTKNTNIK